MTDDKNELTMTARQLRFIELSWANACGKHRENFILKAGPLPPGAAFVTRSETRSFWERFANRARATLEESDVRPIAFDDILSRGVIRLNGESCVWWHNESDTCGALRVSFSWVAQVWGRVKGPYSYPVLNVAAEDLSFGVEWEVGETGTWLRRWGVLAE